MNKKTKPNMDKSRNTRRAGRRKDGREKGMNETSFELLDTALPKDTGLCDFSLHESENPHFA